MIHGCTIEIPFADCLCADHAIILRANRPLYENLYRSFSRYIATDMQGSGFAVALSKASSWITKALAGENEAPRKSWGAMRDAVRARDEARGYTRCETHDAMIAPGKACRACERDNGKPARTTTTGVQLRLV